MITSTIPYYSYSIISPKASSNYEGPPTKPKFRPQSCSGEATVPATAATAGTKTTSAESAKVYGSVFEPRVLGLGF